ncbi:MAG: UbiA prenyltransferase family protein [Alphaproteobacteria bacterium]|nr:UbiA prenyltransferase family protein [Alphaproteobacteria bacterium]
MTAPDPALPLTRSAAPPLLVLLRPHQWVKNAFIAAPLFFTPTAVNVDSVTAVLLGMLAFCALSSAVYVLNDYMDRAADRLHPRKRHRPLAAGSVPIPLALALMVGLAAGGLALAAALAPRFAGIALVYLFINALYSLKLKDVSIVDVMLVSLGFVLRVYGGAELIHVLPSVWIVICTGLLALFMALAKRRDDLVKKVDTSHRSALEGYTKQFIDTAITTVLGALLVSYLIYTTDQAVMTRIGSHNLYLTTPFVIAGVLRYLQITVVEERSGSPTALALTDKFLVLTVLGWLATFGVLIYG